MDDSLCRCGAHTRIIDAIQSAAGSKERRELAMTDKSHFIDLDFSDII